MSSNFKPFLGQRRLKKLFDDEIEKAEAGDMQSKRLILKYLVPELKPVAPTTSFKLRKTGTPVQQCQDILQAIASAKLNPETGLQLIKAISELHKVKEISELAAVLEEDRENREIMRKLKDHPEFAELLEEIRTKDMIV